MQGKRGLLETLSLAPARYIYIICSREGYCRWVFKCLRNSAARIVHPRIVRAVRRVYTYNCVCMCAAAAHLYILYVCLSNRSRSAGSFSLSLSLSLSSVPPPTLECWSESILSMVYICLIFVKSERYVLLCLYVLCVSWIASSSLFFTLCSSLSLSLPSICILAYGLFEDLILLLLLLLGSSSTRRGL